MATRTKTASTTARKTPGRRIGRPTNVERAARVQSQALQFVDIAAASFAAGMKTGLGIEGGVQTLGSLPASTMSALASSAMPSTPQGSQSQTASSAAQTQPSVRQKRSPGRSVEEDSAMSKTRRFYTENLKSANPLNRADFVRAAAEKFGYTKETGNTYVSNIEKKDGYKLVRRGGSSRSRGTSSGGSVASSGNGKQATN